jgi:hypothetical protein
VESLERPKLTGGLLRVALLLCGTAFFFWQIPHPMLRFAWAPLNDVSFIVALLLPRGALIQCLVLQRWWLNLAAVPAGILLFVLTPIALLVGTFVSGLAGDERVAEIPWHGSTVRVYRIRTGALSSDFIRVRQEMTLLPGVRLVRNVESFPDAQIEAVPTRDGVEIRLAYGEHAVLSGPYRLKRFVYF